MNLAIYGRRFEEKSKAMVNVVFDELEKHGAKLWIYEKFHVYLQETLNRVIKAETYTTRADIEDEITCLITIGGDGTILDVVTEIIGTNTPILGMNTGRLGFLANNSREDVARAIDCLHSGDYKLDHRSVLELNSNEKIFEGQNFALNELTIHKKDSSSMVTVHTYVNDDYLNSYWADGVIVATPTGSTAYSLSCGGPIMSPSSNNFVITPVAPHNLNVRPIILNDTNVIKLQIGGRENEYLATLDSRSETITNETIITIKKAENTIALIKFEWQAFFDTIRNKLLWGRDRRN